MQTQTALKAPVGLRNPSKGVAYPRKGTHIRTAVDRAARINAAIVAMLRQGCMIDPNSTLPLTSAQ
jgi:hypothetical protein